MPWFPLLTSPGNYGQALEDLRECLALQQTHLEADSRLLAETHYQLGLAHGLHCQYGPAIQHLHLATAVIHARLGASGRWGWAGLTLGWQCF